MTSPPPTYLYMKTLLLTFLIALLKGLRFGGTDMYRYTKDKFQWGVKPSAYLILYFLNF